MSTDRVSRLREIAARLGELLFDGRGEEQPALARTVAAAAALLEREPAGAERVVVLAAEIDRTATTLLNFVHNEAAEPLAAEVAGLCAEAAELLRVSPAPAVVQAVPARRIVERFPLVRPGGLLYVIASVEIGPVMIEGGNGPVPELTEIERRRIAASLAQDLAARTARDLTDVIGADAATKGRPS
jgi:hypothetical protein